MQKNKWFCLALLFAVGPVFAQTLRLEDVMSSIQKNHPQLKMHASEIKAMDASVAGARSWMPPEVSSGFWMTPYNPKMWKKQDMGTGMGQYMIGIQQMLPNKRKQQAESAYMSAMSGVEKAARGTSLNQLRADAMTAYSTWVIEVKKISVIDANEKILDFMIRNAEIRYKNNMGKLNAYYKAKAAIGNLAIMRQMAENEISIQRIRLSTLMNAPIGTDSGVDTTFQLTPKEDRYDAASLASNRSDIQAVERQKDVNKLQQQFERSKLKPEFGVKYDHMFGFGGLPQQFNLMAMVRLPMASWSSRMSKASVQSLQFRNEALDQQRRMMLLEASGMASEIEQEIKSRSLQLSTYRDTVIPALHKNYQSLLLAYEQNTEELYMLYDAWEALNMTQMQLLEQENELNKLVIQLQQTLESN